ncbi:MAG: hypothetical protein ACXWEI_01885 [Mycobacterium sp.]
MRFTVVPVIPLLTADLISRARAGDGDAFRELTAPYRRELMCTAT